MSFWKFLGWAWLLDKLFGDNRHQHNNICPPGNHSEYDTYDDNRYDDLEEEIELMSDELHDMDDDRLGFNGYNDYNDYNDFDDFDRY